MRKIRTLKPYEIEVRPANKVGDNRAVLLYIDSRAVTNLLDETYGMQNWTNEFKAVGGQIYGRISVYDEESNRWIYREDTGSESNIEANKGLASDILKRCLVRFGVTELYTAPKIVVPEKIAPYLHVSKVEYDSNRNITELELKDGYNKVQFTWSSNSTAQVATNNVDTEPEPEKGALDHEKISKQLKQLQDGYKKVYQTVDKNKIDNFYRYWEGQINSGLYKSEDFMFDLHFARQFPKAS